MNNEIQKLVEVERYIADMIKRITSEIRNEIETNPMDGVTPLGNRCYSVKLSTVSNNGLIMSPEYYSATKQAEYVEEYLGNCKTATDLISRIDKMIAEKTIKRTGNDIVRLNDKTIGILKKYAEAISK